VSGCFGCRLRGAVYDCGDWCLRPGVVEWARECVADEGIVAAVRGVEPI